MTGASSPADPKLHVIPGIDRGGWICICTVSFNRLRRIRRTLHHPHAACIAVGDRRILVTRLTMLQTCF